MRQRSKYILAAALLLPSAAIADDTISKRLDFGKEILGLGAATGSLVWTVSSSRGALDKYHGDEVYQLAMKIQTDLDNAKASSNFGRAVGGAASAGFALVAAGDPEPTSRISFTVAAYVTKAATNYLADATYRDVQEKSLGVLRAALDNPKNKLTPKKLELMGPEDVLKAVDGLMLGDKTMREVFKDNPQALKMLKANVNDFLVSNSAATLFTVKKTASDVNAIKTAVNEISTSLEQFRAASTAQLKSIETKTDAVLKATQEANAQLEILRIETKGNTRAIQTLSDISYLGWNTEQKLAAVKAGQFPELQGDGRNQLIASLEATKRQEQTIAELQLVSRDIGSLTTLATNLKLPEPVVKALNIANQATSAIIKFNMNDPLGALASLSGIFGGQRSDPAAERHKQLMNYLAREFGEVNQRLERIQKLQEDTLKAIGNLGSLIADVRSDLHEQLTAIESEVVRNGTMLGYIIRSEWSACRALRKATNNRPWFSSQQELFEALGPGDIGINFRENWRACNKKAFEFLTGDILTGNWSGSLVDLKVAANENTALIEKQAQLRRYAELRIAEYQAARNVLITALPDFSTNSAVYLIQIGQPSATINAHDALARTMAAKRSELDAFKCNSNGILNEGIQRIVCLNVPSNSPAPPITEQVEKLLGDNLMGPNGLPLMDWILTVSRAGSLVRADVADQYKFLTPQDFDPTRPPSDSLKATLKEKRGLELLRALSSMVELNIFQQSVAYGDFVPQLVVDILYDPATKSLRSQVDSAASQEVRSKQAAAIHAIQISPILGRNVAMLAVRRTLVGDDGLFPATYYGLALKYFRDMAACDKDADAMLKLKRLFPGWNFEYLVEANSETESTRACGKEDAQISRGAGLVVKFGTTYIKMPSAEIASAGLFEYPLSLAQAVRYREKIRHEFIDRSLVSYFKSDRMIVDYLDSSSMLNAH